MSTTGVAHANERRPLGAANAALTAARKAGAYLGDKLLVPILLAAVAFALGPYISQHWQDHHAEIATKAAIVQSVAVASAQFMAAVETRDTHPEIEKTKTYYDDYRTWQEQSQQVQGQLSSYFPTDDFLRTDWIRFTTALRLFHDLPGQPQAGALRNDTLTALYQYANTFTNIPTPQAGRYEHALAQRPAQPWSNVPYLTAWRRLTESLVAQRDSFVAELVHASHFSG